MDENVSRNGSTRVMILSPDVNETPTVLLLRSLTVDRVVAAGNRKRSTAPRSFTGRLCRNAGYLPVRLFRSVGANVVRVLCFLSCRRRAMASSSSKVSPRAFPRNEIAPPRESHHAEAIEDCIKFINSSRRSC